ncbi:hypothetical protein BGX21_011523, partial [Mortierella sp. AD011]
MDTKQLPDRRLFSLCLYGTDLVLDEPGDSGDTDTEVIVYTNGLIRNMRSGKILSVNRIAAGELARVSGVIGN